MTKTRPSCRKGHLALNFPESNLFLVCSQTSVFDGRQSSHDQWAALDQAMTTTSCFDPTTLRGRAKRPVAN